MELKNVFGARLKNARVINGMSMDDLCAKMNNLVSKQTISKYESGKMLPNSTNLIALANALNVRPDYLLRPFTVSLDKIEFRKKSKMSRPSRKRFVTRLRGILRWKRSWASVPISSIRFCKTLLLLLLMYVALQNS